MIIEEMMSAFTDMGVKRGDAILVSSDVRALIPALWHESAKFGNPRKTIDEYMDDVINALQILVGEEGTLLFPVYNWGFCEGKAFDYNNTLGETGALSNRALKRKDFIRTKHPIYSFAVWGKDTNYLVHLNNLDSFADDSPFAYLHKKATQNISIGAQSFFTFTHYVEQCNHVKYRYVKKFISNYCLNGVSEKRAYSMMVRSLNPEVQSLAAEQTDILNNKAKKTAMIDGILLVGISFKTAFDIISSDIRYNDAKNIMRYI